MRSRHAAAIAFIGLLIVPVVAHVALSAVPGFASFVVAGGSMEPTIDRGSLVYVQETDDYRPDDVITFTTDGRVVTHRIVAETPNGFITRGDGNEAVDEWRISKQQITGEVILAIPLYGYLLGVVGSPSGYVFAVFLPGIILISLEIHQLVRKLR